jgi:hypothetical protein
LGCGTFEVGVVERSRSQSSVQQLRASRFVVAASEGAIPIQIVQLYSLKKVHRQSDMHLRKCLVKLQVLTYSWLV